MIFTPSIFVPELFGLELEATEPGRGLIQVF